ncbi:hypothetical protein ABZ929_22375 [Streptomyces physcomitrii]|uniref:hypothetical protein n=1 Tax=Streptomyces physcomitrii TaxID=2724184 RepID=UPI00341576B0
MTARDTIDWAREEDARWAAAFELRLVLHHEVPSALPGQALAEVRELTEESGAPAEELLGDPRAYADSVAAERVGEKHTGAVDLSGLTPAQRFRSLGYAAAFTAAVLTCVHWAQEGMRVRVSPAAGLFAVLLTAAVLACAVAAGLYHAGRHRAMSGWCLAAAGLLSGAIAAGAGLSDDPLFKLPTPVVLIVSALLAATVRTFSGPGTDDWFRGPAEEPDDARWIRRLGGLLRGRHGLGFREARGHTAEVRSHLAASGTGAQQAYGDVAVYAARLAGKTGRARRRERRRRLAFGGLTALVLLVDEEYVRRGEFGAYQFWLVLGVLALFLWEALVRPRLQRRTK